jgi:hypothetical protein
MSDNLSRRALLDTVPAAAVVVPAVASPVQATPADPIFAAIAEHRAANLDWAARLTQHDEFIKRHKGPDGLIGCDENDPEYAACEVADEREQDAHWRLWRTTPTTTAGFAALFAYLQTPRWPVHPGETVIEQLRESMFAAAIINTWCDVAGRREGDSGVPALAEWLHSLEVAFRRLSMTS